MKARATTAMQRRVDAAYEEAAPDYETQPGHDIPAAEGAAWAADLARAGIGLRPSTVLDVGTGTGVFARWWAGHGARVTGMDPSAGMLQVALQHADLAGAVAPRFLLGAAEQAETYPDEAFDLICCRQAACYFADPIEVFGLWRERLAPGGQVLVIEGLWPRHGFGDGDLVDALPLSCVHTRATLAYLLSRAGFPDVRTHWLSEVNACHGAPDGAPGARYAVTAGAP